MKRRKKKVSSNWKRRTVHFYSLDTSFLEYPSLSLLLCHEHGTTTPSSSSSSSFTPKKNCTMIGRILFSLFIVNCFVSELLAGQSKTCVSPTAEERLDLDEPELCDENTVNMHMLQCYQRLIDPTIDATSAENAFYLDGNHLCQ